MQKSSVVSGNEDKTHQFCAVFCILNVHPDRYEPTSSLCKENRLSSHCTWSLVIGYWYWFGQGALKSTCLYHTMPSTGLQMDTTCIPQLYVGSGDLNSDPHMYFMNWREKKTNKQPLDLLSSP